MLIKGRYRRRGTFKGKCFLTDYPKKRMIPPQSQLCMKEMYNVEEFSARRYCNTFFAMIYVYITSWTRSILIKAVAGDDCQYKHPTFNI